MIGSIRDYILTAEGAADESIEAEEMDDKLENEVSDIVISHRHVGMRSDASNNYAGLNCTNHCASVS